MVFCRADDEIGTIAEKTGAPVARLDRLEALLYKGLRVLPAMAPVQTLEN
jgi:hypothetical protein